MKLSMFGITLAAVVLAGSAAKATSVTIDFPTVGDSWADNASGTSGVLTAGGFTGKLKSQYSRVTSAGQTYPLLNNFVATSFSVTLNIDNTQYDTINYSIGGDSVDVSSPTAAAERCTPRAH